MVIDDAKLERDEKDTMIFQKEIEIARNRRFFKAIRDNKIEKVRRLINRGFDVNETDAGNVFLDTPLYIACSRRHIAIAQLLLESGADPNARDLRGRTALHNLIREQNENPDIWHLLLSAGADVNAADDCGMTPLHFACYYALVDITRLLLQRGAQPDIRSMGGATAFEIAVALPQYSERREEILATFQELTPEFYFSTFCTSAMAPGGM